MTARGLLPVFVCDVWMIVWFVRFPLCVNALCVYVCVAAFVIIVFGPIVPYLFVAL